MKRETETELGFWFRFFLMAGNVHHHGNLGEAELVSIFLNFHYTLLLKSLATDYEDDLARGHEEKTKAITLIINDGKLTVNDFIKNDNNFISINETE